ncbi:GNAT family N-acetyltransferase [Nesterenkonia ebinurensis]|uniref:GNAT family N-acetyltransferase n=1 Tax=Nesterenkonia ebinurensis TaxID=2608252 RepID=UPI00123E1386|nr:GNAT family N-acetyltransferase [Nesterenkonia ebinurensis]
MTDRSTVTTTTLQMLQPPEGAPRPVPRDFRIDRTTSVTPEYARFLYGLVGGPWYWIDRLTWTRPVWEEELSYPGTEFYIPYRDGVPQGFVHIQPRVVEGKVETEIRYFGLVEEAIGQGLGGALLERGIQAAWTVPERFPELPEVRRVWVYTCSLDGPTALANYQARGFEIITTEDEQKVLPPQPLGPWRSTTGLHW